MLGGYSSTWVLHFALLGYFVLEVFAFRYEVCRTVKCLEEATRIKNNMDKTIKPCNDFYRFACGNYLKDIKLDSREIQKKDIKKIEKKDTKKYPNETNYFITVNNMIDDQLIQLLNGSLNRPNEPRSFQMARKLYKICLRQDLIEKRGVGFLLDMIKSAGGWPVLEGQSWDAFKFNWVETVHKLHELGLGGELFSFAVSVDPENSFKRVIEVDGVSFELKREEMAKGLSSMDVKAYISYLMHIAQLLGANHDYAETEMNSALRFEVELAKMSLSKEERRDLSKIYNPMEINVLQARYPIVNWKEYMEKQINNITRLRSDELIIVKSPTYLDKLQVLLKKTPKRIVANYLIWKGVSSVVGVLTMAMRNRRLFYLNEYKPELIDFEPRWKECLRITIDSMPLAISSMYIRHFFKPRAKEDAIELVENIHGEMFNLLKDVDWMDEKTRSIAIEKNVAMKKHVGYLNELLEDKKLDDYYEMLEITGEHFLESILNVTKFGWNYNFGQLRKKVNKTDWRSYGSVAVMDAYYNPMENSLYLLAGILQNVFFSPFRPRYMNYGAIGTLVAHEITHGFDYMGLQFDKVGNRSVWWKPETTEAFKKKVQCVIDQATNYTIKAVKRRLNGMNTQVENVAEIGGIKLSYKTYKSWAEKHKKEPRLAGLEKYTPQQMFWLSAANVWCTAISEETLKQQMINDHQPPAEYRVNGAMKNQKEFAKDFNCRVGSKMNPVIKCNVW